MCSSDLFFFNLGNIMKKKAQLSEVSQLHRLEGQLHGVEKMILADESLQDVLQQIEAVRGNLKSLEKRLLGAKLQKFKDKELDRCFDYLCKIS